MPSNKGRAGFDDVDDFMANIYAGKPANPVAHSERSDSGLKISFGRNKSKLTATTQKEVSKPRRKFKLKRSVKVGILVFTALVVLTCLGIVLRKPVGNFVSDLLAPPSPFSQELVEKAGFILYYPTKLPSSYKIETDSVRQPEGGVVIYAITDDAGKRININMQKKPEGLNLDPLYNVLTDLKEIDTKYGKVKSGISGEGIHITNILTDKSWIIINTPRDNLSQEDLVKLINSLRES